MFILFNWIFLKCFFFKFIFYVTSERNIYLLFFNYFFWKDILKLFNFLFIFENGLKIQKYLNICKYKFNIFILKEK